MDPQTHVHLCFTARRVITVMSAVTITHFYCLIKLWLK